MTFTYYGIIQDVLGVVIAMFSLRVLYFFIRCWLHRGFARRYIPALASYSLLLVAGVTLAASPFGILPWSVFLLCCLGFRGIQRAGGPGRERQPRPECPPGRVYGRAPVSFPERHRRFPASSR